MAHSLRQQPRTNTHTRTNHQTKPALHPSLTPLSSLLHITLSTILPLLFFTTFVIAGTIVLSYSLSLNQPVPARFVVGVSAAFAALVGLSVWVFVWSRVRGVWKAGKPKNRQEDIENIRAAHEQVDLYPVAPETGTEQTQTRPLQQQQQQQHALHPHISPSSRHTNANADVIAHPIPAYRGLPRTFQQQQPPPPPRRSSVELSAIPERSIESDHRPSPPFPPHNTYHHPVPHNARRPPVPYRSPSVISLPESLRAPGRGAETPKMTVEMRGQGKGQGQGQGQAGRTHWGTMSGSAAMASPGSSPSPALGSGAMQLPMPRVPEPLRFGASILGREREGEGVGGVGGGGRDDRRRLVKVRGRGMG